MYHSAHHSGYVRCCQSHIGTSLHMSNHSRVSRNGNFQECQSKSWKAASCLAQEMSSETDLDTRREASVPRLKQGCLPRPGKDGGHHADIRDRGLREDASSRCQVEQTFGCSIVCLQKPSLGTTGRCFIAAKNAQARYSVIAVCLRCPREAA